MGLVKNCLTPRYISARCIFNIAEITLNRTTSELDLCILLTHYWNFSTSMGHNSAENYWTWPKFKLNLCILLTHLYNEFQFKMSIFNGDNERKLKINGIFLSPRGITLLEIIQPDPNYNSTCVFSWQTYVPNFIWKSPCMTWIMSGNWIQKDGMTERGNTICPSHFMAGA